MSLSLEHKEALRSLLGQESVLRSALYTVLDEESEEWRKRAVNSALSSKPWEQRRDEVTEAAARAKYADGLMAILKSKVGM